MFTDIKVGYSCNNRCVHCVVDPSRDDLRRAARPLDATTEQVLAYIAEAQQRGSAAVVLTGGEVTLRRDFPRLLAQARGLGLEVVVQTNGRRLHKLDEAGVFTDLRASFTIAVHGPDAALHDAVTRKHGSFDETLCGIRALLRRPALRLTGKLVISRLNVCRLEETMRLLADVGVRRFNVAFPHAERFPRDQFQAVVPRYTDVAGEVSRCAAFAASSGLQVEFETLPYCAVRDGPEVWMRSADATLASTRDTDPGYIRAFGDEQLHDWETERQHMKWKGPGCASCLFDKACEGPWHEYVDAFGAAEFEPFTDLSILQQLE